MIVHLLLLHAVSAHAALGSAHASAADAASTCPAAPPGLAGFSDKILSWAKWTVLSLEGIGFFASISSLIYGRVTHHPKGARLGIEGIGVCIVAAMLFAGGYAAITSIAGSGC